MCPSSQNSHAMEGYREHTQLLINESNESKEKVLESIGGLIEAMGGWAEIGSGSVLIFVVFMILKGELIPSKTNDFLIAERDIWKETAQTAQDTVNIQAGTIDTLMETAKTIEKVLNALPSHDHQNPGT